MTERATGVVGGAALPHAPQFFTLPPTEDAAQVARIERVMRDLGDGLRALGPDVVVIIANDHLENFLLHCVPSFTFHLGPEATGAFAGRNFRWRVPTELATSVLRDVQAQGFDPAFTNTAGIGYEFGIPLTFCGFAPETPLLPVYVNTYAAPQPSADRCYAFGQALARALQACGTRAVVLASGGLSHYPGTDRYASPDLATDEDLVARLATGNLRALLTLSDGALDATGNVEARSWLIAAGALGERVPDVVALEPSWHHNYAVLGWTSDRARDDGELHYAPVRPDRVVLSQALYALRLHGEERRAFLADSAGWVARWELSPEERDALTALDEAALRAVGAHPLLAFLARLQVDLERKGAEHAPA